MVTGFTRSLLPARLLPYVLPDRLDANGVTDPKSQTRGNVFADRAGAGIERIGRAKDLPTRVQEQQRREIRTDGYRVHRLQGLRLARNARDPSYDVEPGNHNQPRYALPEFLKAAEGGLFIHESDGCRRRPDIRRTAGRGHH